MGAIKMQLGYKISTLELPYLFIDHYMTGCASVYPLIYIFSLRRLLGGEAVSVQDISQHFQLLDTDVMNAWRHWERMGLVTIEGTGTDISITFLPVEEPQAKPVEKVATPFAPVEKVTTPLPQPVENKQDELEAVEKPEPKKQLPVEKPVQHVENSSVSPITNPNLPKTLVDNPAEFKPIVEKPAIVAPREGRPQYSVQELALYRSQSKDIERLFLKAEKAMGKLLTYHDMNVIFGFYDWLRLPPDVIEYLLTYCAEHGHRSLRYIEKCALDWAEREIDDLEKALDYVHLFDKHYRSIMQRMGKLSSFPTPAQRKQIDKWLHEMYMPLDVVLEACDRTTLTAEKPSLSYVDKILVKWHKTGVSNLADVQQSDDDYARQKEHKETKTKAPAKAPKTKINRFINFEQRENDYSQREKLERQYLLQRLEG